MNGPAGPTPVPVPARATQAGETPARWAWVEPSVWTPRMLTALDTGVKGGVWFSLIDKLAERLLRRPGVVLLTRSPAGVPSAPYGVKPPTGEPDAGNPPVRFGGRGSQVDNWLSLPL